MSQPDLRDLACFAIVARHRNFRRAARELGIAVSSLSQRLRDLETQLGQRLLNRTTRSVALTEAGERLLTRLAPALADIDAALQETTAASGAPAGRLRINAPEPAIPVSLSPLIGAFLNRYPQIDMDVTVEPALIDIVGAGYDAGIRYGEHLAQDMIAVPIGRPQRYVVVASPDFLARCGPIREPQDLLDYPCISVRFPSGTLAWEFEKDGRSISITPKARLLTTHHDLRLQAAMAGVGFMCTFEDTVQEAMASGQVVSVLDDWCPPFEGPFLYYPSRRQNPPALAAFISFLAEWRKEQTMAQGRRTPPSRTARK